jgi:hypothetical protein
VCEVYRPHTVSVEGVGIARGYRLEGWAYISGRVERFFFTPHSIQTSSEPLIHWMLWDLVLKWLGCEAHPTSPTSAEVKNGGAIPLLREMSSWHGP